jgi:HEAT repeat protein
MEQIIPFLGDRRWFLVRNVVYILGRMGKEQAISSFQKALLHREMRVRREAVQALGFIGGPKAFTLLVKALHDGDVRIRCAAALNLGKVGKKSSLPYLIGAVQSLEFHRRESAEKKAFFDAIGISGADDAIPILQKLLMKRIWFRSKRINEIRQGAAGALALIGSRGAKSILEMGQKSKNASIRRACLQALKRTIPSEKRF